MFRVRAPSIPSRRPTLPTTNKRNQAARGILFCTSRNDAETLVWERPLNFQRLQIAGPVKQRARQFEDRELIFGDGVEIAHVSALARSYRR
jgi:hypothetical protein